MRYRDLRQRVVISRRLQHADDTTPDDEKTEEVATVYAAVEPVSGSEGEQADRQQGLERFKLTFRWGSALAAMDATYWGDWNGKRLNFASVRNVGSRNKWFEVDAVGVS